MPLYEYHCLDCKRRCTILVLRLANPEPPVCTHCRSLRVERLMSRFAAPKSEASRLASLADPDTLAGLDENDPASMSRFMKKMGDEMGEDLGDNMAEALDSPESSPPELDGSDSF